jgi:hypothetical protein
MAPLAAAAYVSIAALAVEALMVGAFCGAIVGALRLRLLWAGPLAAGGYLAAITVLGSRSLPAGAVFGMPLMILTLLTSWLTAHHFQSRVRLRRTWATLVALGSALLLGFLCLLLFRVSVWAPVYAALAADVSLILLTLFTHRGRPAVAS